MLPRGGGSAGRAPALLGAAAARIARKEVGMLQTAIKQSQPLAEAFAGHDRFVAEVMAVPHATAEAYVGAALRQAEQLNLAEGFDAQAWTDAQIAALLRLEG